MRFRVAAPDSLNDGMYWARVITTSERVGEKTKNNHSDTQIHYRFRQINGIYYKVGKVHTGIDIQKLKASIDSSGTLWVTANVNRTGNALFLGTIDATVYNRTNKKVAQSKIVGAVYFNRFIKRPVDISNLPAGVYMAKLRFETQRNDVPRELLPQMLPVTATTPFIIE